MKNFTLLSSVLAASLLLAACETESRDDDRMMDNDSSMMDHGDEDMDHMMGNGMMMDDDMMGMMIRNDEDFLSMMIPHHQEAIDTAKVILEKSENAELKALAQAIVDAQTAEITQMEDWGKEWFGTEFKASDDYEEMMPDLSVLEGEELDQAFIEGMIEHHQMAIMMAMRLQMITERQELKDMADAIIDAQSAEIDMMEGWLN
ncbi:DUF305 domain-containing protein [Candidatus Peregrinibacteria bacterium]|nr:MAG: DUF305 domain-containing protein [Candidatus Peregrinibacteria bacterium]